MTNGDSSPRDDDHLESNQPPQLATVVATTAAKDRPRVVGERSRGQNVDDRGDHRRQAEATPRHPSMVVNLLITAAVALISGVVGAAGYTHYYGPKAGESASHESKSEAGTTKSARSVSTASDSATAGSGIRESSPIPGVTGTPEAEDLKQQIKSLGQKLDRLGEHFDRVQQLLSLAVPLLQRIAPKE